MTYICLTNILLNMNKLHIIVIAIIILFSGMSYSQSNLSMPLRNYLNACTAINEGIARHDRARLENALKTLDGVNIETADKLIFKVLSGQDEVKPKVLYHPDYVDKLLLRNFEIAELDEASLLRGNSLLNESDILISHHALRPNGVLKCEIDGEGHMELLVAGNGKTAPKISVKEKSTGKEYKEYSSSGNASWLVWDLKNPESVELTIVNTDDLDTTFVIATN